jgi:hypothetical protein
LCTRRVEPEAESDARSIIANYAMYLVISLLLSRLLDMI